MPVHFVFCKFQIITLEYKLTKAIIQKNVLNSSFTCPNCPASTSNCFTIDEVDETPRPAEIENIEALDNFESMLSDKNVFIATARRISNSLTSNTPDNRMHEAVCKLFSAPFLCKCSWLGGGANGPKIRMYRYKHVHHLLMAVGRTSNETVTLKRAQLFLKSKLRNSKSHLACKNIRKSVVC